jgi:hypothetical protein
VIFAVICFGFAITGFTSLHGITDPTEMADAKGFAWFWTFLGSVATIFGGLAWWMAQRSNEDDNA